MSANTVNKILIVYASGSGNTKEVSEIIAEELRRKRMIHDICRVGKDTIPVMSEYDLVLMGSYSVQSDGRVPIAMKQYIESTDFYMPEKIAVFGTGDTQWQNFCGGAKRLAKFYHSKYPVLTIEQSPRGSQEGLVKEWVTEVINNDNIKAI